MAEQNEQQPNEFTAAKSGFQMEAISFDSSEVEVTTRIPVYSHYSEEKALQHAQLVQLTENEGQILFYPGESSFEVGDVLFLRERSIEDVEAVSEGASEEQASIEVSRPDISEENGVVVQIIAKSTANYPQASTKALFRLMVNVRASALERSHNEPPEVMDEFLLATFKIRASITAGRWGPSEGRVVSRNVDIFALIQPSSRRISLRKSKD